MAQTLVTLSATKLSTILARWARARRRSKLFRRQAGTVVAIAFALAAFTALWMLQLPVSQSTAVAVPAIDLSRTTQTGAGAGLSEPGLETMASQSSSLLPSAAPEPEPPAFQETRSQNETSTANRRRTLASQPRLTSTGAIEVTSRPAGASVVIDNQPVGTTPLVLTQWPAGTQVVRMELNGFQRWSQAVRVPAGQRAKVAVNLRPMPSKEAARAESQ
jgi:hypothetical protein